MLTTMGRRRFVGTMLLSLCLSTLGAAQTTAPAPLTIPVPQLDWGWRMLELRQVQQAATVDQFNVDYDFRFTDQQLVSGIRFRHQITPDSGKFYQPNHYDHGNGIVAADVDGDKLLDLYFVSQLGRNELWRNLGGGRFENITDTAGVAVGDRVSAAAAFADFDNDGDADLFVTTVKMGNLLFENDGAGRFRDISSAAGVDYVGHSSGAIFFDYDNDGLLDLFVTNVGTYTTDSKAPEGYWYGIPQDSVQAAFSGHLMSDRTEYSILYHNRGDGTFEDVSLQTGLRDAGWSGDAAFVDLNRDGLMDVYVLNMQGDDHYWENIDGTSFRERAAELFPRTPWGSMGVKFFDFDNNGLLDLMLTDMHSDMSRGVSPGFEKMKSLMVWTDDFLQGGDNNIFGNAFYVQLADGTWLERSNELGAENYWPWGISVGDLNADGFEDVFIAASMNFPFPYGINSVLLNNRGRRFLDSEFLLGVEPRSGLTTRPWFDPRSPHNDTLKPWFELDCASSDSRHQLCQGQRGKVMVLGNVGSRSSILFDVDQDGDLDIVTNEFNDLPQVLVSDLASRRDIAFIEIELIGKQSNRDGLGARVTVETSEASFLRIYDGKSGYLSQSSMPLYIGLDGARQVLSVTVEWPSGRTQSVTDGIVANQLLTITEDVNLSAVQRAARKVSQ